MGRSCPFGSSCQNGFVVWTDPTVVQSKSKFCSNSQKRKNDLIKNYHPVSLLSIFEIFFERLIFNSLFKYIDGNELLNPNQSGFCSFDSCVAKPTSIYKP